MVGRVDPVHKISLDDVGGSHPPGGIDCAVHFLRVSPFPDSINLPCSFSINGSFVPASAATATRQQFKIAERSVGNRRRDCSSYCAGMVPRRLQHTSSHPRSCLPRSVFYDWRRPTVARLFHAFSRIHDERSKFSSEPNECLRSRRLFVSRSTDRGCLSPRLDSKTQRFNYCRESHFHRGGRLVHAPRISGMAREGEWIFPCLSATRHSRGQHSFDHRALPLSKPFKATFGENV